MAQTRQYCWHIFDFTDLGNGFPGWFLGRRISAVNYKKYYKLGIPIKIYTRVHFNGKEEL
jgi:hypothetical protein